METTEYALDISVSDTEQNALSDANVSISNIDTDKTYTITTDSSGTCKISNLPPGEYQYNVEKKGYDSDDGTIDVQEDSYLNIRLKKEKPKIKEYSLEININDENGDELSDVNVIITNVYTDKSYNHTSDSSGFCKINLPIGKYNYKVQKNGYYSNDGTKDVNEDSNLNIKLKKKLQSHHLKMN